MAKRSVAELADRKAELLDELSEVNAEIAARAGEIDQPDETPAKSQGKAAQKPAQVATATDKSAENAENTSSTT
jgi:hypothetical protein